MQPSVNRQKLLLQNARVISEGIDEKLDLLIQEGSIVQMQSRIQKKDHEPIRVLDLREKILIPGLVELHSHLNHLDDIPSLVQSAIMGGYTALGCVREPPMDQPEQVEYFLLKSRKESPIPLYPIPVLTRFFPNSENVQTSGFSDSSLSDSSKNLGERLSELAQMKEKGARSFSNAHRDVQSSDCMRKALDYSQMLGMPVMLHCEDSGLAQDGVVHEGFVSTLLGLKGIPSIAEELAVSRNLILAEFTGAQVHISGISTARTVELIRRAKEHKIPVTCDVSPHHLCLTQELLLDSYNPNLKVKAPLRTEQDRLALIKGLKESVIDAISSDHFPIPETQKDTEFVSAPAGVIGLETAFLVVLKELLDSSKFSLANVIETMSSAPRKILGLPKGGIAVGKKVDFFVFDPNPEVQITEDFFPTPFKNSPFLGETLKGSIQASFFQECILFE